MKHFALFFILSICFLLTNAQSLSRNLSHNSSSKPPLDTAILDKWPYVANPKICDNGNYISYTIENHTAKGQTLVIKSAVNSWEKKFYDASPGVFLCDSKLYVFTKNDTLYFLTLGTDTANYIANITSYKGSGDSKKQWIAYNLKSPKGELILQNLFTGEKQQYFNVTDYYFSNNGNTLLIKTSSWKDSVLANALLLVKLPGGAVTTIWQGDDSKVVSQTFDALGAQLAFMVEDKNSQQSTITIWYYNQDMIKAELRVSAHSSEILNGMSISLGGVQFSENSQWIYFRLQEKVDKRIPKSYAVKVDVWSYKDLVLQSKQTRYINKKLFAAAINVHDGKVIRITRENEEVVSYNNEYTIVAYKKTKTIKWWEKEQHSDSFYLFSLKDGSKKCIAVGSEYTRLSFSPLGKFIIYYDVKRKEYFSYDVEGSKTCNISKGIPTQLGDEYIKIKNADLPVGIGGWLDQDAALLIYDNYDIWQVDPAGKKSPVNVTNGYGRNHQIKFRIAKGSDEYSDPFKTVFQQSESLLMVAFNVLNKENGFYRKLLSAKGDPELTTLGPYVFYHGPSQTPGGLFDVNTIMPQKARDTDSWIVQRMNACQAPNYFFTKDFKNYIPLSNLQPQKEYNWLTTELISWKQFDGKFSQGILYKPENFDSHKKYPIIFCYYEYLSHHLNAYLTPGFTDASINIPWFVSHGYLVFMPDIHTAIANITGNTNGMNAYNSVVSAAKYFSKMPWVDAGKMGINGHSFGGSTTNYILTHTHLFAAAAEAAGASDIISSYLDVSDRQSTIEIGQGRMGATLWQRPDLYLNNCPVLNADQVTTPLLIMHNKTDVAVPWGQGVELYMALRRLGKKVWMLQYDDGSHIVYGKDAVDYTIRLTQFFDHYLKGALPPKWMTEGIPASLKGIESGYELDMSGNVP